MIGTAEDGPAAGQWLPSAQSEALLTVTELSGQISNIEKLNAKHAWWVTLTWCGVVCSNWSFVFLVNEVGSEITSYPCMAACLITYVVYQFTALTRLVSFQWQFEFFMTCSDTNEMKALTESRFILKRDTLKVYTGHVLMGSDIKCHRGAQTSVGLHSCSKFKPISSLRVCS